MEKRSSKAKKQYSQDTFAAISAHQLRTPITRVQWSLDKVLSGSLGQLNAKQELELQDAYASSRMLSQTISDLLTLTEIDSGSLILQPEEVDICSIITDVVKAEKGVINATNTRVVVNCKQVKPIEADQTRITKVLRSILQNALTYSKSKGLITISARSLKDSIHITIQDNGIGISKKDQEKVFDKFFRSSTAVKYKANGLGVKLYNARKIIEAHGGTLTCTSTPKVGTTFTVKLLSKIPTERIANIRAGTVMLAESLSPQERQFINITVHELRSPLNNMQWTLELLSEKLRSALTPTEYDSVEVMYKQCLRMSRLVKDLLDVGKLQEGTFSINPKKINIVESIQTVVDEFSVSARNKKITMRVKADKNIKNQHIVADPERIEQVFYNLISNAVKYTNQGGDVTIRISTKSGQEVQVLNNSLVNKSIDISSKSQKYVVVEVADSGIGISRIDQKKIFGRFFRTKKVLQSTTEGTGLGLFISKTIIEAHEGSMWLTSVPNKGTSFFVALPVKNR